MYPLISNNTRKIRWAVVVIAVALAVMFALTQGNFTGYITSWGGTVFKALSGGFVGWIISRYVVGLDLSAIPIEQRPLAGLSQALLIGAYALALATGA